MLYNILKFLEDKQKYNQTSLIESKSGCIELAGGFPDLNITGELSGLITPLESTEEIVTLYVPSKLNLSFIIALDIAS